MARVRGILGQALPAAATTVTLYTVPGAKSTVGKILVCNQGVAATFTIWLSPAGAAKADVQKIAAGATIAANEPLAAVAFMVGATDVIRVEASTATISFTATGEEDDD